MTWSEQGACIGHDPDLWFPASKKLSSGTGYREARAICSRCPVQGPCLEACLVEERAMHGHRIGMRGGLSPSERDQRMRGTRWCWTCGTKFAVDTAGGPRYCSDQCREAARTETITRHRERAA